MSYSSPTRGFTLVELLTVMGLFVLLAGLGLFVSMDAYRGSSFRTDRDLLVALLQHARAQAVNNICTGSCTDGAAHGVAATGGVYIAFQGTSYNSSDPQNQVFSANPAVMLGGDTEVLFAQLTGAVAARRVITLAAAEQVSVITIEPNGRIWWTN